MYPDWEKFIRDYSVRGGVLFQVPSTDFADKNLEVSKEELGKLLTALHPNTTKKNGNNCKMSA